MDLKTKLLLLLESVTLEQQKKFYRMYSDDFLKPLNIVVQNMNQKQLIKAIQQCEQTIGDNKRKVIQNVLSDIRKEIGL